MICPSLKQLFFVKNCFLTRKSRLYLPILNIYHKVQFPKIMIDIAYTGGLSKSQMQKGHSWQDHLQLKHKFNIHGSYDIRRYHTYLYNLGFISVGGYLRLLVLNASCSRGTNTAYTMYGGRACAASFLFKNLMKNIS